MSRILSLLGALLVFCAVLMIGTSSDAWRAGAKPSAAKGSPTSPDVPDPEDPTTTTPEDPTTTPEEPPAPPEKPSRPKPIKKPGSAAKPRESKEQQEAKDKNRVLSRLSAASLRDYEIPLFLLPIYQSCGNEYGIPWTVLASINKTETAFGTNLNVSSAGATGWMQFMPPTWEMYGLDANGDNKKDPYNPVDAICAAARYLRAAGWSEDRRGAVFAYNHAEWYVDEILERAAGYDKMPQDLMLALSGLASAPRYPLASKSSVRAVQGGAKITTSPGTSVVAPNDAKILSVSNKEGQVVLEDDWGNSYTFSGLSDLQHGDVVSPGERSYPGPQFRRQHMEVTPEALRDALPRWMGAIEDQVSGEGPRKAAEGARVRAGQKLGEAPRSGSVFLSIRPSGRRSPLIAPKPVLEGWRMLEKTGFYRRKRDTSPVSIFLLTQAELEARVLADPGLDIYSCGREDIRSGQIDRRVLALLAYLSARGWELGISSLKCGHSYYAASGNVSNHSHGGGVDISVVNGESILGNQQRGSYTEQILRTVLRLQGTMHPNELISLWDLPGDASFALSDHADHIHVGYGSGTERGEGDAVAEVIKPEQWRKIMSRLRSLPSPRVP